MDLGGMFKKRERRMQPPQRRREQAEEDTYLVDETQPSPIAMIYRSELDYLSRCVLDYPNIETGGQLFGFWTNQGVPVVMYVIGPGRNANHQPTFFNQDGSYLQEVGNALLNRYGLCHIGEWHSHHQLGLARPSGHDARTMHNGLIRIPQRRLLLCICNYENGRSTVNAFNFHENDLQGYADAQWQVLEMESPYRPIADRELAQMLIHPRTPEARHGRNNVLEAEPQPSRRAIKIPADYWLARPGGVEALKAMAHLTEELLGSPLAPQVDSDTGIVQLHSEERAMDIRFSKNFPDIAPEILLRGASVPVSLEWKVPLFDDAIVDSYRQWVATLFNMYKNNGNNQSNTI